MTTLVEHARALIAFTIWADDRILAAADGISDEQYAQLRSQFEHMLGTRRYWHANWTGDTREEPKLEMLVEARAGYAASNSALRTYMAALTPEEWDRAEQWWLRFGFDGRMALGESITQVVYHGVQHRSEVAVLLSQWGHSPGDMDYLTFLQESSRAR
jgi:uncharacterized damage-inducible protein DinB